VLERRLARAIAAGRQEAFLAQHPTVRGRVAAVQQGIAPIRGGPIVSPEALSVPAAQTRLAEGVSGPFAGRVGQGRLGLGLATPVAQRLRRAARVGQLDPFLAAHPAIASRVAAMGGAVGPAATRLGRLQAQNVQMAEIGQTPGTKLFRVMQNRARRRGLSWAGGQMGGGFVGGPTGMDYSIPPGWGPEQTGGPAGETPWPEGGY
jgi:hypothetical protein